MRRLPAPVAGDVPEDLLCTGCRAEIERSVARHLGTAADHDHDHDQDEPSDAAYAPAPPSAEYRQWREQQAAAKGAPF
ncbi:hypothetical protein ACR6C2_08455 [Streptomyces sp. INA 01156]